MFKIRKEEVLVTSDNILFSNVCSILKENQISHKTKIVNTGTQNRRTGSAWGRVGERIDLEIYYYIYVSSEDKDRAKYLVAKCIENSRYI